MEQWIAEGSVCRFKMVMSYLMNNVCSGYDIKFEKVIAVIKIPE